MRKELAVPVVAVLGLTLAAACSKEPEKAAADAALQASISCYIADQQRCEEALTPSEAQVQVRSVECSSMSGVLKRPAACPTAAFEGRCSTTGESGAAVHRFYKGRDVVYEKSFCEDTAKGSWSPNF